MLAGFTLGLIATFFWSLTNLIDKYLVQRFTSDLGIGPLLLLSAFFPGLLMPVALLLTDQSINIPLLDIGILLLSGILTVSWIYFYLGALYEEDVSIVMSLFQLTPIFALGTGYLLLSETPTQTQLLFGGMIVLGSVILSVERSTGKFKLKLLAYISLASALIALMNTAFKFSALDADFWVSIFWHGAGAFLTGLCIFCIHKTYRRNFKLYIKENWGIGLGLNALNETFTVIGDVFFAFAILLAPLALIQTTEAYQPVFVFIFGSVLTILFPKWFSEDISRSALIQKIIGITTIVIGSIMLITKN